MNAALRLSLDELLLSLRQKRIPIQFEIGTFIVLEACEAVIDSPARVACSDVSIDDEGRVLISASTAKATSEESTRALINILCDLLLASAPGIPGVLLQLVEHGPSDDRYALSQLKDDLEAALVPLNRSATRRVLARLVREAKQEEERRVAQPQFVSSRAELDADFDTLVGRSKDASCSCSSGGIDSDPSLLSEAAKHDSINNESDPLRFGSEIRRDGLYESDQMAPSVRVSTRVDSRNGDRRPAGASPDHVDDFADIEERTDEKSPAIARVGLATIALIVLVIGFFVFTYQNDDDTQTSTELESVSANTARESKAKKKNAPLDKPSSSRGVLKVNSTPSLAQVMLYLGRGLARIKRVPLGIAHEFVAIADGFSPSRTLLAADAKWRIEDGIPFTSLEMELTRQKVQNNASSLGSTRLPRQHTVPSEKVGTVEIRTEPPEAAIYQLVGFTPDLTIENLSADKPIRLLVYAAGYRVEQVDIDRSQWIERDGKLSAEIEVELETIEE